MGGHVYCTANSAPGTCTSYFSHVSKFQEIYFSNLCILQAQKQQQQQQQQQQLENDNANPPSSPLTSQARDNNKQHPVSRVDVQLKRSDADGLSDSFLRQKEAELRDRRERERHGDAPSLTSTTTTTTSAQQQQKLTKVGTAHGNNVNNTLQSVNNQNGGQTTAGALLEAQHKQSLRRETKSDSHLRPSDRGDVTLQMTSVQRQQQQQQPHQRHSLTSQLHSSSKSDSNLMTSTRRNHPQSVHIPPFHFPRGRPTSDVSQALDATLQRVKDAFSKLESGKATKATMSSIVKVGRFVGQTLKSLEVYRVHEK